LVAVACILVHFQNIEDCTVSFLMMILVLSERFMVDLLSLTLKEYKPTETVAAILFCTLVVR